MGRVYEYIQLSYVRIPDYQTQEYQTQNLYAWTQKCTKATVLIGNRPLTPKRITKTQRPSNT